MGAFATAVQAGITLAVLYILTRGLWLAIGTHLAWNVWQIFLGLPVSGTPGNDGYWTARITGGTWLTGGTFGYQDAGQCSVLQVGGERQEGCVVTTLLWLTVAAVLLHVAIRRGRIRPLHVAIRRGRIRPLRPPEHAPEGQEPQHRH